MNDFDIDKEYNDLYLKDLFIFKEKESYEDLEKIGYITVDFMMDITKGINFKELNMKVKPKITEFLNKYTIKEILKNGKRYCNTKLRKNFKNVKINNYSIIHKIKKVDVKNINVPKDMEYYIKYHPKLNIKGFNLKCYAYLYKKKKD